MGYEKLNYEILYKGTNSMLKVKLDEGESMKAESGAMVAMSNTLDVEGKLEGGLMGGIGRLFSGESFFFQTIKASRGYGEVLISPPSIGDIQAIELDGNKSYLVQKDGFLAGSNTIEVSTKMQNLSKGVFSGEGFFVIGIKGFGTLFVNSYGAIHTVDLAPGEEVIIDNEHLVAWESSLHYSIELASKGWISSVTSGEGLVCRFNGPGRVFIQTRSPKGFGQWVKRFIPS